MLAAAPTNVRDIFACLPGYVINRVHCLVAEGVRGFEDILGYVILSCGVGESFDGFRLGDEAMVRWYL